MKNEKVRLTQMVTTAGCAAKIFPDILSETLKDINWATNEYVLVCFEGKDDAGVYKISDKLALIHTTDFFTPVVDDPYVFGQIAADQHDGDAPWRRAWGSAANIFGLKSATRLSLPIQ